MSDAEVLWRSGGGGESKFLNSRSSRKGPATEKIPQGSRVALHRASDLRPQEFWAVRGLNFDVKYGESLGLLGKNGAGKSTVLKLVSGILGPTTGRVELYGRLGAMIELGTGFHPMLTGRENIYITAAVMGMKKEKIDRRFEQIVEFAGIGDFLDTPIKFYSSGMLVRLGFSVLAHLDPEIMLVDEILAVGDLYFQHKCIERIHELRGKGLAFILVSHSLYRIESLCDSVIWIENGEEVMHGGAREVVRAYRDKAYKEQTLEREKERAHNQVLLESHLLRIEDVSVLDSNGRVTNKIGYGEPFGIRIKYFAKKRILRPLFNLRFLHAGFAVFETSMLIDGGAPEYIDGPGVIECRVKSPSLLPKCYDILLFVRNREGAADLVEMDVVSSFTVSAEGLEAIRSSGPYAIGHLMEGSPVHFDYEWDISKAVLQ